MIRGIRGEGSGVDRRFLLPIVAAFSGFLGIGAIVPVLPAHMRLDLGSHDVEIGFVIGAYSIAALVSRIVSGRLVDARGGILSVKLGLVLSSLAGLFFVLPVGLPGLVAARMAQGVAAAFVFSGAAALILAEAPVNQRARAMGLLATGPWGAMAIGPIVGGLIGSFWGTALFVLAMPIPVLALVVRSRPPALRDRLPAAGGRSRLFPREALRPGAAFALINTGQVTLTAFLVLRVAEIGGGGPLAYGAFAFGVLITRMLLGSVVDRTGPAIGMLIGCVCAAAGMTIIALAPVSPVGVAGAFVCGIGLGFPWLALVTFTFSRVGDHEKGAAMGMLIASADAAAFCGALLAGAIAHSLGYSAVFAFAAIAILASGAVVIPSMRVGGPGSDAASTRGAELVAASGATGTGDR